MKLIIFLLLLIPIASFLKFIFLDIIDGLVVTKKSKQKSTISTNEIYEYRKAQ